MSGHSLKVKFLTVFAGLPKKNAFALEQIERMDDIKISPFPKDVMGAFKQASEEIIAEIIDKDPKFAKIYKSFSDYKNTVEKWTKISEYALLQDRYE